MLNSSFDITPFKIKRESFIVSKLSKNCSLSSCISLSYAKGSDFITTKRPIRLPYNLPVLPLISSSASGFLFCGIIDEPVLYSSGSLIKPNSLVAKRISSSAKRDICIPHTADENRKLKAKSLSETASIEFFEIRLKPKSF